MKLTAESSSLRAVLKAATDVAPAKGIVPEYSCVYLCTQDDGIRVYAHSQDMELEQFCPALIEEEGEALVPARMLLDYVSLADEQVSLSTNRNILTVKSGRKKSTVTCMEASRFSPLKLNAQPLFSMPGEQLAACMNRTSFCASTDETRRAICGVHVEIGTDGHVRFVGMDGFRVSICDSTAFVESDTVPEKGITLPNAVLKTISSLFGNADNATVSLDSNRCVISSGSRQLIFPLLNGEYVEYGRVIPKTLATEMKLNADDFMEALRLVEVASAASENVQTKNLIRFDTDGENGCLKVSASTSSGSAETSVPCDLNGQDMTIFFNVRYVRDLLAVCARESGEVSFGFTTAFGVAELRPLDANASGLRTYVVPVRTQPSVQ